MLKKRNKFLAISLATVGVIGAGSVAFATWLVGVQQKDETVKLSVLVDQVEDSSIKLTATLASEQLKVAETTAYDNSNGNALVGAKSGDNFDPKALTFGFETLQVKFEAGSNKEIKEIKITCETDLTGDLTENNKIKSKKDGSQLTLHRETTTELSYIELNEAEITIPGSAFTQEGSTGVYKFNNEKTHTDKMKFKWGSFFDNKSPVDYYNSIYSDGSSYNWTGLKSNYTSGELEEEHTNIKTELSGMSTYLNGLEDGIKLKVSLELQDKAA